ncbi:MAG: MBL fold metallo-hydrolase [Deltaproteobacteria bacterium]|nr:MBL fold metallo-hydrolase [Deltaproteobacteria bacterium]
MPRTFPYQLSDRLFVLGDNLFLTYLLRGETCALIDLAASGTVPLIRKQLRHLAIDDGAIENLVIQHAHWDHVGALPYLREAFPRATVLGSEKAREVLGKTKIVDQFRQNDERWCSRLRDTGVFGELPDFLSYPSIAVDRIIRDNETLSLGGIPVEVLATPGHSACSVSLHLPTEDTVLASDAVGFYLPESDDFLPMFFQSVGLTLASISRLEALGVATLGYGHSLDLLVRGKAAVSHALRRLRERTREFARTIQEMADAGAPEGDLLAAVHRLSYRDFLAELYLPDYLQAVSPYLLKAILSADRAAATTGNAQRGFASDGRDTTSTRTLFSPSRGMR